MRNEKYLDAWKSAEQIDTFYRDMEKKGVHWSKALRQLEKVDVDMAAYGDWILYRDRETGRYYEGYFSIGD